MNIPKLIATAQAEIGVAADPSTLYEDLNGRIRQYRQAVTAPGYQPDRDPEPWCADFVSWCFAQTGTPLGPGGTGFAYNPYLSAWLEQGGFGFCVGEKFPAVGDIVILDLNLNGTPDHCGIIEEIRTDSLVLIEGNYSDSVARVERKDFGLIHLYGRLP